MKNKLNNLPILLLFLGVGLGCSLSDTKTDRPNSKSETKSEIERLDGYTLRGIEFAYYKVSANLSREDLIAAAQKIHEKEPKAQLILVDDDSKVQDYIAFAKAISAGKSDVELPKEWADKHIVANVQKYVSGKFMLC